MRTVLHIGLPKTGSTSIQENFTLHHDTLRGHGILFPLVEGRFLHPFHVRRVLLAGDIESLRQPAHREVKAVETLREIERAVALKPDVLFLSSEDIAAKFEAFDVLKRNMDGFSDDTRVLAYFRDPVSYYRSMVQHHVKSQSDFPPLAAWDSTFLKICERGKAVFGDAFRPVATNKGALRRGSIVDDALGHCLDDPSESLSIDTTRNNSSSSSAVSVVLQDFMLQHQKGVKQYGRRNTQLRKTLETHARKSGLSSRATLKDGAEEAILAHSRDELLALRDAHGLVFDAVDYDALATCKAFGAFQGCTRISDVFEVDDAAVAELKAVANEFLKSYDLTVQ